MKKKIALLLTLSFLLPSHMTNAKRTISMEEYALCGIGIITTLGGLKLIHKATKKKGTKKQVAIGALLTVSGISLLLVGPRKVRAIHNTNSRLKWNNWTNKERRQLILNSLNDQMEEEQKKREPSALTVLRLQCIQKIIQYDPLNLIVDNVSWGTIIKEGFKEKARNLSPFRNRRS